MNVLIYVRTINNHHKYFGRHISRLVCQHCAEPTFCNPICVFNHAQKRGIERRTTRHPAVWCSGGERGKRGYFRILLAPRLIKIITSGVRSLKFARNRAIPLGPFLVRFFDACYKFVYIGGGSHILSHPASDLRTSEAL